MNKIFTNIYEKSIWGNRNINEYNGSSGEGSDINYNKDTYIPFLQNFIKDNNIKNIVDLGCGDFVCGPLIYDKIDIKYTGYDAYKKIIKYNSNLNKEKYNFIHLDFYTKKEDIISADLCIIKDVLQHWSLKYIYNFMDYLIDNKKFKYILLINCCNQKQDNTDIEIGQFRDLSCNYLPLKKYKPIKLYNFNTKEISMIDRDNSINMNVLKLLKVYHFDNKIRLGSNIDGGYVLGDLDEAYDCYISAGISNEESFSRDFIEKYNMNEYNSFGFDGTIKTYPYKYTNKISFIQKNINSFNDDKNSNLSFLIKKYNNIFLKMDIEGGEYDWLLSINEKQLNKFKQIVIEIHGIKSNNFYDSYYNKIRCLTKLNKTHYLIHAHGNNCASVIDSIPDVIELCYINKSYFTSIPRSNKLSLPSSLDFPNKKHKKDIDLNFYPFVKK